MKCFIYDAQDFKEVGGVSKKDLMKEGWKRTLCHQRMK